MLTASVLFSMMYRDIDPAGRLGLVLTQLAGPCSWIPLALSHSLSPLVLVLAVASFVAISSHPAHPNIGTFFVTLCGGFLWWLMGWFSIIAELISQGRS